MKEVTAIYLLQTSTKIHKSQVKPPAYNAKLGLNTAAYAKLSILFKTTHALNVKARPAKDYIWMNELHKSNGLDGGDRYSMNVHNCTEFASAIADVQRNIIRDNLTRCKFVSASVDGSMDNSSTDNEMIYLQTCQAGSVQTNFIVLRSSRVMIQLHR